eukprot:scaffold207405_cov28-Tisochrysis_lutea.AAC.1
MVKAEHYSCRGARHRQSVRACGAEGTPSRAVGDVYARLRSWAGRLGHVRTQLRLVDAALTKPAQQSETVQLSSVAVAFATEIAPPA